MNINTTGVKFFGDRSFPLMWIRCSHALVYSLKTGRLRATSLNEHDVFPRDTCIRALVHYIKKVMEVASWLADASSLFPPLESWDQSDRTQVGLSCEDDGSEESLQPSHLQVAILWSSSGWWMVFGNLAGRARCCTIWLLCHKFARYFEDKVALIHVELDVMVRASPVGGVQIAI